MSVYKIVFTIFAVFFLGWIFFSNQNKDSIEQSDTIAPAISPPVSNIRPDLSKVEYEGQYFVFDYWIVPTTENISLTTNFDEQKTLDQLVAENRCKFGINGGFYSEESDPLGLVVINGNKYSKYRENKLFNGLVAVGADGFYVGDYLENNYSYAVQSGPVLIRGGRTIDLELIRDKPARRMLAAKDAKGNLVMMYIGTDPSSTGGPFLDQMPILIRKISDQEKLNITDAVNLDGGSASGYVGNGLKIESWQPVGSWWCVSNP